MGKKIRRKEEINKNKKNCLKLINYFYILFYIYFISFNFLM